MKLAVIPHNDDEAIWCSFTLMKERPMVVIVFDSYVQVQRGNPGADAQTRRFETLHALLELGLIENTDVHPSQVTFLGLRDDAPDYGYLRAWLKQRRDDGQFDCIICPAWEQDGHEQHNGVARVCRDLWPAEQRTEYLTYTRTGGRSRAIVDQEKMCLTPGVEVIPTPDMIGRKHRALACYKSQMEVENCRSWFMGPINEYLALPPAQDGAKP